MTSKQEKALERVCDKWIAHIKSDKEWNEHTEGYSRSKKLTLIEKSMRKSILNKDDRMLDYAVEYVSLHW